MAMSTGVGSASRRRAPLDGLRTVAIAAVFAFHCVQPRGGGFLGVDVFFVLSGYLMTTLVAKEIRSEGRVRYVNYLLRRLRRLYPALLAAVALALCIAWLADREQLTLRQAVPSLLYVKDIFSLRGGVLDHTWSLSVEAQFYLVWPFVMAVVLKAARPARVLWVLTGLSVFVVAVGVKALSGHVLYYTPIGHLTALLVGSAIALTPALPRALAKVAVWAAGVGLLVLLVEPLRLVGTRFGEPAGMLAASGLAGALLLALNSSAGGAVPRFLGWRPMAAMGERSYSFYLYHQPILVVLLATMPSPVAIPVALLLTVGLSLLSWRYLETRFHKPRAVVTAPQPEQAEAPASA